MNDQDPNSRICPDFSLPVYNTTRQPLLSETCNDEQVAAILARIWQANIEVEKTQWQERIALEAQQAVEETRRRAESEALARAEEEQERLEILKEDQKKHRSKFVPIPKRPPPLQPMFVPVPYAKQKIKQGHYVELSYFMNRGHALAKSSAPAADDESLIPSTDPASGDMKWIPANTKRDSMAVIPDQDLNTEDLSIAIPRFLNAITAANWPAERIEMLKEFWSQLLTHNFRYSSSQVDVQAIILYQAEQRAAWHEAIMNVDGAWDIGIISNDIMRETREKAYFQQRDRNDAAHRAKVARRSGNSLDSFPKETKSSDPRRIFETAQAEATSFPLALCVSDVTHTPLSFAQQPVPGTMLILSWPNAKIDGSTPSPDNPYVATGNKNQDVPTHPTANNTVVQGAATLPTAPMLALERSKFRAKTPYIAAAWERQLQLAGLSEKYPKIPSGLRSGFIFNFPVILRTQSPPNKPSIIEFASIFKRNIEVEISKGRYIGPFSKSELESVLGPFQTSPFDIIPKPERPGKFRLLQNLSFPIRPSDEHPNRSINAQVNSNDFPCSWGTFATVCLVISRLPLGSQAATRDVAEAYRTIPLHSSQWPATVVRTDEDTFYADLVACFGAGPAAGGYGHLADAGADLFRAAGILPISKWVDDHLFFRIRREHLSTYNQRRENWRKRIEERGPNLHGGRLWYGGDILDDGTLKQFDEDCRFNCRDLSGIHTKSPEDEPYTYCMQDIDRLSQSLGIPWETSKDVGFLFTPSYIGFTWDLSNLTVALAPKKQSKYLGAIEAWHQKQTHNLQEVQSLYGKLLHTCHVFPIGRSRLTGLEAMLTTGHSRPFTFRHAPKRVGDDLQWWTTLLKQGPVSCSIPRPRKLTNPGAYSDASSGIGVGIVIGQHWRAWRLIPGWQTLNGKRDIAWAEVVGFELLVESLTQRGQPELHYQVYGDNKGVVEGWWNGRSRNTAVNGVFQRIQDHLVALGASETMHLSYTPSASNPADKPSRGEYPPREFLLPGIELHHDLAAYLIDSEQPISIIERQLYQQGAYSTDASKFIKSCLAADRAQRTLQLEQSDRDIKFLGLARESII